MKCVAWERVNEILSATALSTTSLAANALSAAALSNALPATVLSADAPAAAIAAATAKEQRREELMAQVKRERDGEQAPAPVRAVGDVAGSQVAVFICKSGVG